jgi:hypothetical protein
MIGKLDMVCDDIVMIDVSRNLPAQVDGWEIDENENFSTVDGRLHDWNGEAGRSRPELRS